MTWKRFALPNRLGLLVLAVVISTGALLLSCAPGPDDQIVIGGVLPLTGDAATFGVNASRGAELAVAEANALEVIPSSTIVFRAEDSRGEAAEAVSAANKLIEIDRVQMMIGDVTSAGTHAILHTITNAKVPLISPAASDPALSGVSPFFARVWPSDVYEASVIAKYAREQGYANVVIVFANTDYGVAMVDEFVKAIGSDHVASKIGADRETLNYRPTIERLRRSNADALFIVLYPEDYRRFLQQLAEQQFKLPILATATFEDPMLLDSPGANRVVFASPTPPSESDGVRRKFLQSYEEKFHEDPGVLSDTGYDAAWILIRAYAEKGVEGPEAVMDYIRSLSNYQGASGTLTFDEKGDVKKQYGLRTVRDKAFVPLNREDGSTL